MGLPATGLCGPDAARFFYDYRTDVVPQTDAVAAVDILLDQGDIADLAIEDLRKWGHWDVADRVLELYSLPSHDVPIIRRSIIKYALTCPKDASKRAAEFETRFADRGDHVIVNGRKFYATGALLAHLVPIVAVDDKARAWYAIADRNGQRALH